MPKTTIRLTGRKSLPHSAFDFDWVESKGGTIAVLNILESNVLSDFPPDARVRVALRENKNVHLVDFGTLDSLNSTVRLEGVDLTSPSAELRVVRSGTENEHLLLGSTRLPKVANKGDTEGILHFQVKDTTPFLWELNIEEDAYPVLYLSDKLEEKVDPVLWVTSNQQFMTAVFPTVIEKVFQHIFLHDSPAEEGWMSDWIAWAETTMGCKSFPENDNDELQEQWLVESSSRIIGKMGLLDEFVNSLKDENN